MRELEEIVNVRFKEYQENEKKSVTKALNEWVYSHLDEISKSDFSFIELIFHQWMLRTDKSYSLAEIYNLTECLREWINKPSIVNSAFGLGLEGKRFLVNLIGDYFERKCHGNWVSYTMTVVKPHLPYFFEKTNYHYRGEHLCSIYGSVGVLPNGEIQDLYKAEWYGDIIEKNLYFPIVDGDGDEGSNFNNNSEFHILSTCKALERYSTFFGGIVGSKHYLTAKWTIYQWSSKEFSVYTETYDSDKYIEEIFDIIKGDPSDWITEFLEIFRKFDWYNNNYQGEFINARQQSYCYRDDFDSWDSTEISYKDFWGRYNILSKNPV